MAFGKNSQLRQVEGSMAAFDDDRLAPIREQAKSATVARRKVLVVRLPLPAEDGETVGEVGFWSAAVQQVEQHQWRLASWSVCPEASGPVAYAVFNPA